MRHLILMRHAEAGYAAPSERDYDRPLTPNGKDQAAGQAKNLLGLRMTPDIAIVSPARRTSETWAQLKGALGESLSIDFEQHAPEDLYQAMPDTILNHVHAIPEHVDIALIVSHNPGIHEAALQLSQPINGQLHSDLAVMLQSGFSPATMAVFECKIRQWSDVNHETVTLRHIWKAR